jgi:peptidoglycan/xylan/chitin deacetylase (PgdA/CDA1 family)
VPQFLKLYSVWRLRKLCSKNKWLCLTYDDGPSQEVTLPLSELLQKKGVRGTFYAYGEKLLENKEIIGQLQSAGHDVQSHANWHKNAWKKNPVDVYFDIKAGIENLINLGITPTLFRPPFGKVTLGNSLQILFYKMKMGWWTIDSGDTWSNPLDVSAVVEKIKNANGGVVLMHDHHRFFDPKRNSYVLELTSEILEMAEKNDIEVMTHQELQRRKCGY